MVVEIRPINRPCFSSQGYHEETLYDVYLCGVRIGTYSHRYQAEQAVQLAVKEWSSEHPATR